MQKRKLGTSDLEVPAICLGSMNWGKQFNSYSIMTTEPNKEMKSIHTRMPVILQQDEYDGWLADTDRREDLEPLLNPYHDNGLDLYEVSRAVNVVRNNEGELITPLNSK